MFYDAHTHLNSPELFGNYDKLLNNFLDNFWKMLVNVWVDYERTEKAIEISQKYPNYCLSTVWFHPSEVIFKNNNWKFIYNSLLHFSWWDYLKEIEKYMSYLIKTKKVVAIGECWLDYHYSEKSGECLTKESISRQKELFILQCEIAEKYKLPIVIHSRNAFNDTLDILKKFKQLSIYFHCWWYGLEEIKIIKKTFPKVKIWFDWNITYKKANNLRESIKYLNLNDILLETDAPYLTPQILRWEQNQPAYIRYIYDYVAKLKNINSYDLESVIELNFFDFYGLKIV